VNLPPAPACDLAALREWQFPVTRRHAHLHHATFGPPSRARVEAACTCLRTLSESESDLERVLTALAPWDSRG
jgi:hypothetical protein